MYTENDLTITQEKLTDLPTGSYLLADVRDADSFAYGTIPGAVNLPDINEEAEQDGLPHNKTLVLFCMRGERSLALAETLRARGYDAVSLIGGYAAWIRKNLVVKDMSAEVENALRKRRRFRDNLFNKFAKAVVTYDLVKPGDRISVCISGGKDSMLMAKLFQELLRHRKFPFSLEFLVMDPGYNELNRTLIETNAKALGIPITVFDTRIFDAVDKIEKNPCYLCARMRRGWLYKKAKELGCNKIALGHHYDDVIETILMAMLYAGKIETMMPKLHSQNFEGMELIRPLYLVQEADIIAWRDYHKLRFLQCACRFTERVEEAGEAMTPSKREEMKRLIARFREEDPVIAANIFNSVRDINLYNVIGYHKNGVYSNFLDEYEALP